MDIAKLTYHRVNADFQRTLEQQDKVRVRWLLIFCVIAPIVVALPSLFAYWFYTVFLDGDLGDSGINYVQVGGFFIVMFMVISGYSRAAYKFAAKFFHTSLANAVAAELVPQTGDDLIFLPQEAISSDTFARSYLFNKHTKYRAKHLIRMQLEDMTMTCCQLHLLERRRKSYSTVFKGWLYVFELADASGEITLIYPVRTSVDKPSRKHYERFVTQDEEFDKVFEVYTTDLADVRKQITDKMIEVIKRIKTAYGKTPFVSLASRRLFIAVPSDTKLLEPSLFRPIRGNTNLVHNFAKDLEDILNMHNLLRS